MCSFFVGGTRAKTWVRCATADNSSGREVVERSRMEHAQGVVAAEPDLLGDRLGGRCLVSGDHHGTHAGAMQSLHEVFCTPHDGIPEPRRANPNEPGIIERVGDPSANANPRTRSPRPAKSLL